MDRTILFTGATGFIGRNICPILENSFTLLKPSRQQLNLMDEKKVRAYLCEHQVDAILHFANPNPSKNKLDLASRMYDDSLQLFNTLSRCSDLYNRMLYAGSGAEYDKSLPMKLITEEQVYRSQPEDAYGRAKQEMNRIAEKSDNIVNLRLFGCYGPTDHCRKFITHCIRSILFEKDITIRKDCYFDYLYVTDLVPWVVWLLEGNPAHRSYNASSGTRVLLSEIANIVREEMQSEVDIVLLSDAFGNEYTASNERIIDESGIIPSISLREGIRKMIDYETSVFGPDTEFDGE